MKNQRFFLRQAAIWLGIFAIVWLMPSPIERPDGFFSIMVCRLVLLAGWFNLAFFGLMPLYFSGKKGLFGFFSVAAFVAFVVGSVGLDRFFGFPEKLMFRLPADFPKASLTLISVMPSVLLGLIVFAAGAAIRAFSAFESKKSDEKEANRRRLEAELALLKSQINPHFLLNTLNNLYALALTDPKKTPDALLKLSEMVRYILYDCSKPKVPLKSDLDFIQNFIELQRQRLSPNVVLVVKMPDSAAVAGEIEPMILISFVENAFKHGLTTRQPCRIFIEIMTVGGGLEMIVENDLLPPKSLQNGEVSGIGLANARQRLEHSYPKKHSLTIQKTAEKHRVELLIDHEKNSEIRNPHNPQSNDFHRA